VSYTPFVIGIIFVICRSNKKTGKVSSLPVGDLILANLAKSDFARFAWLRYNFRLIYTEEEGFIFLEEVREAIGRFRGNIAQRFNQSHFGDTVMFVASFH